MTSISEKKKVQQRYGLLMENKCLYKISSIYEKRIDTAEDYTTQAKHF